MLNHSPFYKCRTSFIKRADKHWRYAWMLSLLGVAYSVYLTSVSIGILKTACPYCLTSLGLMSGILALTTYQRPADLVNFSWRRWLTRRIPMAAAFVFVVHLQYVVVPHAPENPIARPLAEYLVSIDAKFYGASWCEHCQAQKKYFGDSASLLPYIECKPGGPSGPLMRECRDAGVSTFPTWIIRNKRFPGVLTLTDLAEMSGFKAPVASPN